MSRHETRDEVMRLLVDHGFWQDLGTVRCSRFASDVTDALAAPSPASPAETREGRALADRIGALSDFRLHDLKVYVSLDDVLAHVRGEAWGARG